MQTKYASPLLAERLFQWLLEKASQYRVPLISALVSGFLAHGFAFSNKLVNHDEVFCLFRKGGTVVSGRWGLGFLDTIFPNVSMPWIYGLMTILLLSVSVCVLVSALEIRGKLLQALAGGFVLTFPSLTGTFGYMFTASSYGVAFLLAVLSVWCLRKKNLWHWVGALVCMVGSLSIYQSYISLSAALLVLVLIRDLLEGDEALAVLRRGIAYVAFLIVSLGLYWIATQVILKLLHVSMGEYAAGSVTFRLSDLPRNITLAYRSFFESFARTSLALIPTAISRRLSLLLLLCGGVCLPVGVKKCKKPLSLLLLAALLGIFPLAVNCMYLITAPESIHTLVLYGFVCVYLLALTLLDLAWGRPTRVRQLALNAGVLASLVIILSNIYVANQSYLTLHLRYENAYAFYTGLISDLRQDPGFTEDTRLAVLGTWQDPAMYTNELDVTNYLTGVTGFKPDSYSKDAFLRYYIGVSLPFASEEEAAAIAASPEYAEMPVYPYYGSMRKIGDVMVIKLSK